MSVMIFIATILFIFKTFPDLLEKGEIFVAAFKKAHEEVEEEARKYGEKAYSINFYSPNQHSK